MSDPILAVRDLVKWFPIERGILRRKAADVKALDGVDLTLHERETVALVGETGSGKTTLGRTVLKLLEPTSGTIEFEGRDITRLTRREMMPLRRELRMIFQDPYSSLNPRHTVGTIISAAFEIQKLKPVGGIKSAVIEIMERVGLGLDDYYRYPSEFSGGQRQRIGIARALATGPKVVVADEPVSALDISIQAQVINLLKDLQDERAISYLLIAHDLSMIKNISDRVAVMYLGHIVEIASTGQVYRGPLHPYTYALMSAVPVPDPDSERQRSRVLLSGDLPSPIDPPSGCVFRTRCWRAQDRCSVEVPRLREVENGHAVACHFPLEGIEGPGLSGDLASTGAYDFRPRVER